MNILLHVTVFSRHLQKIILNTDKNPITDLSINLNQYIIEGNGFEDLPFLKTYPFSDIAVLDKFLKFFIMNLLLV
jgi:hypothetical protein